ncbi:putative MFS family arabinose efflux permease [Isoptericola jiangsuensis]|uniref:Putative MFS family arabinose efflux permease n=1 Tax=Isoptericola jiangsuensis TaxID=548579 RepID=A0A2A9F0L0_9MICO|nr:MFS transporter [Isoptericola jiangsuensis]PFG44316.1 putative MFS family arabinose efflux permease [Isoptericola jiangsuensis]
MSATFSSLTYPNYRLWFGAALVANVGTWMQRIAQDWLVLTELTDDSGVAVGITTALQFLPFLIIGPWTGLLADRLPRRRLLMCTQGAMGLLALGLGALVLSGAAELWHVYAFALGLGVVTAFDNPVRQTFVAELVPPERLANAVGLNSASFNAARLVGPGTAGLLIAAVGSGWVFVVNGLTFAATIAAVALMKPALMWAKPRAPRAKGQIREGVRYVRSRSDIVVIMVVMAVVSAFGLNFQLTSAMMARVEFGRGAGEFGLLGSVLAIGSLTGALLAARRDRPRVRLVIGAAFAFAVATAVNALMPTYLGYVLTTIPVGLAALTMMTAANSTIQTSVDPVMRGRVMALYMMVFLGATPIGSPVVGWVGEVFGPRSAILLGSATTLAVAVGATVWAMRNWRVTVRYRLRRRPHLEVVYLDAAPVEHVRAA